MKAAIDGSRMLPVPEILLYENTIFIFYSFKFSS